MKPIIKGGEYNLEFVYPAQFHGIFDNEERAFKTDVDTIKSFIHEVLVGNRIPKSVFIHVIVEEIRSNYSIRNEYVVPANCIIRTSSSGKKYLYLNFSLPFADFESYSEFPNSIVEITTTEMIEESPIIGGGYVIFMCNKRDIYPED